MALGLPRRENLLIKYELAGKCTAAGRKAGEAAGWRTHGKGSRLIP
jgi:hypothetical protein